MAYTLLIIWLFITFLLFLCVYMYSRILLSIDELIRKRKFIRRQKEIDETIDFIDSRLEYLEDLMNKKGRRKNE